MLNRREVILGGALAATGALSKAAAGAGQKPPTLLQAVKAFIATLDADQKTKALLPFNSDERLNWFYIPKDRNGLWYASMTADQQAAAHNLLQVSVSKSGYQKVEAIRQLELVLKAIENGSAVRNPDHYYYTIFGDPSSTGTWGWRYEGHHVSLHWTVIKGRVIASSPQFLGTNPAEVRSGPQKGTRVLATEEDLARALVKSLDDDKRKIAVLSETAPPDVVTTNTRKAAIQEDKGLAYSQMDSKQQGLLISILKEYASVQIPEIAQKRLEAVHAAGLDNVKFGWMGGLDRGQPHYYRIQGSTFLVEYDNTQNDANHVHSVWRDFNGDFGVDLLALHYHTAGHDHGHDV